MGPRGKDWLIRLWHRSDDWPLWVANVAEPIIVFLLCDTYGHEGWVEMDNRTICCVFCARRLGDVKTPGDLERWVPEKHRPAT